MLQFPEATGTIEHVAPNHYDDLVEKYVNKVSKLDNVLGVVLFGSVSTPGLSDIDLVVTVADNGPWPRWEDISLTQLAAGHPAESVVAHDIFVWPQAVAKKAESFFYVDQQTVLHGQRLGGDLDSSLHAKFRELLTMDYLIHRFESLSALLCVQHAPLRSIMLFISTFRHTCHLASDLGLISAQEAAEIVADINALRERSVAGPVAKKHFDGWPERLVRLLWKTVIELSGRLDLNDSKVTKTTWQPNSRVMFLNSSAADGVDQWRKCIQSQRGHFLSKYVRAMPVPAVTLSHVQSYCDPKTDSGQHLQRAFPAIFGSCTGASVTPARQIRIDSVVQHWDLVRNSKFTGSSGKGYAGVGMPGEPTTRNKCLKQLAKLNAFRMPTSKTKHLLTKEEKTQENDQEIATQKPKGRAMKVLLLGYYGHRNFGDDLLMKLSLDRIRKIPGVTQLAVTATESGIDYVRDMVPYLDKVEPIEKRRDFIHNYDRVIFGGGGTVFEYRKDLSAAYKIRKRIADFLDFGRASKKGTQFASIGLGIGPFADGAAKTIAMNLLSYHDLIYVRDTTSLEHAQDAGLAATLSHDLSFMEFDSIQHAAKDFQQIEGRYCFIVRNFKYGQHQNKYLTAMIELAKSLQNEGNTVRWLSFQKEYDAPVIETLSNQGFEVWNWDPDTMTFADAYQEIGTSSLVVTSRMHGTCVAGMLGVPTVNIGIHPKLKFASQYFDNSVCVNANPNVAELTEAIQSLKAGSTKTANLNRAQTARDDLKEVMTRLGTWIGQEAR